MPKHENISTKIDYLSVIFDNITAEELILFIIGIPYDFFLIRDGYMKHKEYTKLYEFAGIKIYGDIPKSEDNPDGLGCYLELKGKGCYEIEQLFAKQGYSGICSLINKFNSRRIRRSGEFISYHITRLDIAIDDKNEIPFFTIEQIKKKVEKGEFRSSCKYVRINESATKNDLEENNGTAKTVYLGSGKSEISIRFYDKDKEVSTKRNKLLEDIGSWKRTEIQLRDDKAQAFTSLMIEHPEYLGNLALGVLAENVTFLINDKGQANKSRWKTCEFWKRFIGAVEEIKLQTEKPINSLLETQEWLQYGGTLSAVDAFIFLEHHDALGELKPVHEMLQRVSYSPMLSSKIVAHLNNQKRADLIPYVYQNTRNTTT